MYNLTGKVIGREWGHEMNWEIEFKMIESKKCAKLANIDINIYTAALETLLQVIKADIYADIMPDCVEA